MFSYVFMKVLEVWPRSYDRQMEKASSGRLSVVKRAVAEEIPRGAHVLEIGCGTGDLAVLLVSGRGAMVDGFDLNPAMVAIARERIEVEKLSSRLNLWEMGVEGMDGLKNQRFEAVVSTLVFSELSADERRFALKNAYRVLKPCGRIIIADEVVPRTKGRPSTVSSWHLPSCGPRRCPRCSASRRPV